MQIQELKILILEDDFAIGTQIEKIVEKLGYEVVGLATNSEECIKIAKSNPPDLLISDIDLGEDISGIDVAQKLFKTHKIPVIFVTGNASKENLRTAHQQVDIISFLSKPFKKRDLENSIESAIIAMEKMQDEEEQEVEIINDRIFVKKENVYHKVMLKDILWLEADGAYSKLFTEDNDFLYSVNLNKLSKRINNGALLRVHSKYIINPEKVDRINKETIYIGNKEIGIGRVYASSVKQKFKTI